MQFDIILSNLKKTGTRLAKIKGISAVAIESSDEELLKLEAEAAVYKFLGRSLDEMINGNTASPEIQFTNLME